jgi:dienelactone hydrolase
MKSTDLRYELDGLVMTGYLADGSNGASAPGVLVAHEAPGLDDHMRSRAELLAEEGYVALALDLYGDEPSLEDAQRRHAELMTAPYLLRNRATAALRTLESQPNVDPGRLAALGFCQGGITALELARAGAPILAAIGIHPGLMRPAGESSEPIKAKILMMVGDEDPVVPEDDRRAFVDEMTDKRVDWQLHLFGGVGHTFTNPAIDAFGIRGFRYDATAAARAWTMARNLLEEVFCDAPG